MSSSKLRLSLDLRLGVPNGFHIKLRQKLCISPYSFSHFFHNVCFFQTDQLMSEKLTGADHTKLDDQFTQMEKITDVFLEVEVSHFSIMLNWLDIKSMHF